MPNWNTEFQGAPQKPPFWTPQDHLRYPTTLVLNGKEIVIDSYEQHHELIQKLFKK